MTGNIQYTAYGRYRQGSEAVTENRYTGQKLDGSGLYYYNARYYDPHLGTFISPDTLVPDPTELIDYNRYAYARANPLKYNDPTGHSSCMALAPVGPLVLGCQAGEMLMRYGPTAMQLAVQWGDKAVAMGNWLLSNPNTADQASHSAGQNAGNSNSGDPNDPWGKFRKPDSVDKNLVSQLGEMGVKHDPNSILRIQQLADNRIVFLESGNNTSGLQHIISRHGQDFANRGIALEQIPDVLMNALAQNKIVGYQGTSTGRPIYEVIVNNFKQFVAITVGNNGYIVGANPVSPP